MDKNDVIIILGVVFALSITFITYEILDYKESMYMSQQDYEQCKKNPTRISSELIWVKDCSKYLKSMEKYND